MANTPNEIKDLLSIHLTEELRIKYGALLPLFDQITWVVSTFNRPSEERKLILNDKNLNDKIIYYFEIMKSVYWRADKEGKAIPQSSSTQNEKMESYRDLLAEYILGSAEFLAHIHCVKKNAVKGIGGCQELSEISMALLMYCTKVETQESLNIEAMAMIAVDPDDHGTHEFLVINRDMSCSCEDVKNWGKYCLIFDPYLKKLFDINNIPSNLSLATFLTTKPEESPYKIVLKLENHRKRFVSFYDDSDLHSNYKDNLKKIHESIDSAFYQELCNLLPAHFRHQIVYPCESSMLSQHLSQKSGLSFTQKLDRNGYANLVARLETDEQISQAEQLISSFNYGRILESTTPSKKVLFFYRVNDNDDEKVRPFRAAVQKDRDISVIAQRP